MLCILKYIRSAALVLAVGLLFALLPSTTSAQGGAAKWFRLSQSSLPYVQLQVLLPGEVPAPGTGQGKLGTPEPQVAGTAFVITVRACDASWNTVPVSNVVSISSSDATAMLPGSAALVNGEVTLTATLNAAGSFRFTARDESDSTIPAATSALVTTQVLQGFLFARVKKQTAGESFRIDVTAVDPNLNVVRGFDGAVQLDQVTSLGPGRMVPNVVTFTNGEWSGNVTLFRADETNAKRGNVTIDAILVSDPRTTGISNSFEVRPNSFTRLQIVVPGQTRLPGSISGLVGSPASQVAGQNFNVDVYATDDWWNPGRRRRPDHDDDDEGEVKDRVRITSSDPLASTPVSARLVDGFRQFTVSLGTVGMQTLTVVDLSESKIFSMTSDLIPVVASGAHHFEFDPISGPIVAGDSVFVTVRAADTAGNTVSGFSGNGILTANTGPGSISPQGILFAGGLWSGYVTFRGAGASVRVTCADFSAPPHIGVSNSFQVLAGRYAALQVLLPGQTARGGTAPGFIGLPTDQNAGTPFNVTVRAVDPFWNRVSGISHTVALSSTDQFAFMPADTGLVSGEVVVTATLHKGGSQTITATDVDSSGVSPYTSSPVFILPGTYSQILLLAPGEQVAAGLSNGRAGTATDQSVGFAFTVTVYAVDQWFNPMPGVTDVVRLTSTDPLAEMPADTPMLDGRADVSVRLATGGFQLLTAANVTQPAMPTSTTQVKAISSGFHLEATVTPTSVVAGEPFNLSVQVTNDAGAVIQEINSFIHVAVQNASTQAPGQGTLLNTQFQLLQGRRTIAETYTFAEPIVLVVTDDAGNAPAITSVVTVGPGAPDRIELSVDPPWVTGNTPATVTARVVDGFDNGIPAQPVQFQLVSGTGTLTALDTVTTGTGVARARFLSPLVPEIDRIRATSGTIIAELDIETTFVNPNQPPGSVTNYPNPFHPGDRPTTIAYKLSIDAVVTLSIYTLSGGLVFQERFDAGALGGFSGLNEVTWDGRNGSGDFVASGGYIVVLEAKGNGETIHSMRRKIAVVR